MILFQSFIKFMSNHGQKYSLLNLQDLFESLFHIFQWSMLYNLHVQIIFDGNIVEPKSVDGI